VLECVINVSEGRRSDVLGALSAAAGNTLLDVHRDADHHRSVFTLAGAEVEEAARRLTRAAVTALDLRNHAGVHPRIGVVDVVPFAPLGASGLAAAVGARDRFAAWASAELDLPCFLYGPERTLPEIRRSAFRGLAPDTGPSRPHPTAGACAVGARPVLVAYNVWLDSRDRALARRLAAAVRGPDIRALGLAAGGYVQVSMNLIDPLAVGPAVAFDDVRAGAAREHVAVRRAELVGLVPEAVLAAIPPARWAELDLSPERTIEARLS
jgi:glutamate formiminotransferase